MYDEPTAGLDPVASTVVEDLMRKIHTESFSTQSTDDEEHDSARKSRVLSYIVVTHQHSTIHSLDRLIMLH